MIPDELIARVREATDIVELVGQKVALKRSGANFKGLCPFHQEKTPSFTVHAGKQIYHCFGCGAGGDAFGFLMKSQGLGFLDAVKACAERAGIALPEDGEGQAEAAERARRREALLGALEKAATWFRRQLTGSSEAQGARLYAAKRGLSEETQERFQLGYAPKESGQLIRAAQAAGLSEDLLIEAGLLSRGEEGLYARFRGRLMFPIQNAAGRVVGFGGRLLGPGEPKYLNSPETPVFQKGSLLYALPQARDAVMKRRQVLLVEGYMDALACHQAGLPLAVAALGTALGEAHARQLKRYADEAVLVFDADQAGMAAARRGSEALLAAGLAVKALKLEGAKDPDEFLQARGLQAFELAMRSAQSAPAFFVATSLSTQAGADARARAEILQGVFPLLKLYPTQVEALEHLKASAQALGFPEAAALEDYEAWRQRPQRGSGSKPAAGAPPPQEARTSPSSAGPQAQEPQPPRAAPVARPLRPRPDALALAERELLALLVEHPALVAEAAQALPQPGFSQPVLDQAAGLLWRSGGRAVMALAEEPGLEPGAAELLRELALAEVRYSGGEAQARMALASLLARLRTERLKLRRAAVLADLKANAEPEEQRKLLAEKQAIDLEIQTLSRP